MTDLASLTADQLAEALSPCIGWLVSASTSEECHAVLAELQSRANQQDSAAAHQRDMKLEWKERALAAEGRLKAAEDALERIEVLDSAHGVADTPQARKAWLAQAVRIARDALAAIRPNPKP